ncbi:MAG: transglutaminase domain-containing protein [Pseudomonadota bacterium]
MPPPPRPRDESDPGAWLGDTPMLNLRDDKLRLRVKTVTQFSRSEAERLRSICEYVASIPFNVPAFAGATRTRITLAHRRSVGWYSKAALFQAMLRTAGFPARVRMIRVDHSMYRGLANSRQEFALPVVEVWTGAHWIVTDSYVYDPRYLAAAQEAVEREGWRSGYGVHLDGQAHWDGRHDALVMIVPDRTNGAKPAQFLGVYDDPQEPADQLRAASFMRWLVLVSRNRLMSIRMNRAVARLRDEAGS